MPKRLYTDRTWVVSQYLIENKSSPKIALECNCSSFTVYRWLKNLGTPIRSHSKAMRLNSLHISISDELLEFLEGELLGDGHVDHLNKWTSSFFRSSKYRKYLVWVSKWLTSRGMKQVGQINEHLTDAFSYQSKHYSYQSKHYVELKNLQKRWYRKAREDEKYKTGKQRKFIKIVPENLKLTPLMCRQWYLGDGSVQEKSLALSTMGFAREEVSFLCQLLERLRFKATVHTNNSIWIWKRSVQDFFDYIGHCPEKISSIYKYKWVLN